MNLNKIKDAVIDLKDVLKDVFREFIPSLLTSFRALLLISCIAVALCCFIAIFLVELKYIAIPIVGLWLSLALTIHVGRKCFD